MRARLLLPLLLLPFGCSSGDFTTGSGAVDAETDSTLDATSDTRVDDGGGNDVADGAADVGGDTGGMDAPPPPPPMCDPTSTSSCPVGGTCLCCPAGGASQHCLCTTHCTSKEECKDPALPRCNQPIGGAMEGICTPTDFLCAWGAVSTRKAKQDITYVDDATRAELARQALAIKLATYKYKSAPDGKTRLGYILEDAPHAASSDMSAEQVDVYAYASMVLAATQEQQKRLDALEKQLAELKATCAKK